MRTPGRRALHVGIFAVAAAIAAAADATIVEPNRMTTTEVELPEGPLAAALDGEKVVHLSDLHLRGLGLRERRLIAVLREQAPALVVVTGDYADTPEGVDAIRTLFAHVRPRMGVVAVPGNNDYFRGRQDAIFDALRDAGVTLLRNHAVVLDGRGGRFAVAGVDDPFFGRDDAAAALAEVPGGTPALLLAHSPSVLQERGDAMLFNAGDADGPWGEGWFWQDGSHFRGDTPSISFESSGAHRLRIQRREDGAGVGAVRLVPASAAGPSAADARGLQGAGKTPPAGVAGAIDVDLCAGDTVRTRGSWRAEPTEDGGCALFDAPDAGVLESGPEVEPLASAEVIFEAPSGIAYRVWVRLHSPTTTGRSDSIFMQFSDAVDGTGMPRFRIDSRVPPAAVPGLALVLAGHTHGGQIRIPWLGPVERNLSRGPFVMGRYDLPGMMVYVSRGIGTSYLPVRFACAPEVVVIVPPRGGSRT